MLAKFTVFALAALAVFSSITSAKRRIYGGVSTEIQNFPWIVAILREGQEHCGGSIIAKNFVLTAAHCIYPDIATVPWPLIVKYGTNRPFDKNSGTFVQIKNYVIHQDYSIPDQIHLINDIAILQLQDDIIFSSWSVQITLRETPAKPWETAAVAGWGKGEHGLFSHDLKSTDAFVVDHPECKKRAHDSPFLTMNQICTLKPGKGVCFGDSGGPLIIKNLQVGIVSYGLGFVCKDQYFPAVYTGVAGYKGFIQNVTQNAARWSP